MSRCGRAAGRACCGRRRSAPSTAPAARPPGSSTSPPSPSSRSPAPARRSCSSSSATTASRARSGRSPTRRCSTAAVASSATSRSRDWPRIASGSSPGRPSATTTAAGSARTSPATARSTVSDVTARWACFGLWGPRAREILAPLTPDPLDFGYMRLREITVGDVPVRALRVTFVGELGWELYCPTEYGAGLWRALFEAGEPHGLLACGYRAIDSLRLEKGYRVWAADITPDETPLEAGLEFCVSAEKSFIGSDALASAGAAAARDHALRSARDRARQRAGARRGRDRGTGHQRRLRLHGGALDRLRLPAHRGCRGRRRWRSTSSASGSAGRSRPSRCSTPPGRGSAGDRLGHDRERRLRARAHDLRLAR